MCWVGLGVIQKGIENDSAPEFAVNIEFNVYITEVKMVSMQILGRQMVLSPCCLSEL